MVEKKYTPTEIAVKILQKTEELVKSAICGLKPTAVAPVPGVISPSQSNTASPMKVGTGAVVKTPKSKKMGQATDKPSIFFGKTEEFKSIKKSRIENLRHFLERNRSKH